MHCNSKEIKFSKEPEMKYNPILKSITFSDDKLLESSFRNYPQSQKALFPVSDIFLVHKVQALRKQTQTSCVCSINPPELTHSSWSDLFSLLPLCHESVRSKNARMCEIVCVRARSCYWALVMMDWSQTFQPASFLLPGLQGGSNLDSLYTDLYIYIYYTHTHTPGGHKDK